MRSSRWRVMIPPPRTALGLRLLQLLRRVLNRLDDLVVAGAAAEVAGDAPADLFFGRVGVLLEQVLGAHDHARRAIAALQAVLLPEALLQGMELGAVRQPLDRLEALAIGLHGEGSAALDRAAVHQHGAGAAAGGVAADVGAGQVEHFADEVHQQHAALDLCGVLFAVDGDSDLVLAHQWPPSMRSPPGTPGSTLDSAHGEGADDVALVVFGAPQVGGGVAFRCGGATGGFEGVWGQGLAEQFGLGVRGPHGHRAHVGEAEAHGGHGVAFEVQPGGHGADGVVAPPCARI